MEGFIAVFHCNLQCPTNKGENGGRWRGIEEIENPHALSPECCAVQAKGIFRRHNEEEMPTAEEEEGE